eukprot:753626-Hanusia_phi.AAC.3
MEISVKLNIGLQSMRSTSSTWNKQKAYNNFKMQILGEDRVCSAESVRSEHLATRISELLGLQHALQGDLRNSQETIAELRKELQDANEKVGKVKEKIHTCEILRRQLHAGPVKGSSRSGRDIIRGLEIQLKMAREEKNQWALPMISFDENFFKNFTDISLLPVSLGPEASPQKIESQPRSTEDSANISEFAVTSLREHNSYLQGKVREGAGNVDRRSQGATWTSGHRSHIVMMPERHRRGSQNDSRLQDVRLDSVPLGELNSSLIISNSGAGEGKTGSAAVRSDSQSLIRSPQSQCPTA